MELTDIRHEIDRIDDQLVKLFAERMDCSRRVAEAKRETGKPIRDRAREREIVNRLTKAAGEQYAPYVSALYGHIFDLSRSLQSSVQQRPGKLSEKIARALSETQGRALPAHALVACQGVEGSYQQQATEKLFSYPDILYFDSFDKVFSAVEKGMCQYGILPIENSTAGSVTQVYDLMEKHHFYICGAQKLRLDHRLMRKNGDSDQPITEIVSHEQALRQCSRFLEAHPEIRVTRMENTAVAAKYVSECGRDDVAAIASKVCAELYGLDVVNDAVSNSEYNYTRFICISKDLEIYPGADKTSLMLVAPHRPGSLYQILARFYTYGLNIIKLESRPIPNRDFEFMFYFDVDCPVAAPEFKQLMSTLGNVCEDLRYLGSYSEVI